MNGIDATSRELVNRGETSTALPRSAALERALRRAGTAFMFAVFGIGALFVAGIAFPIVAWRQRGEARHLLAQRLIHRCFRAFERLGNVLHLFEVRDSGVERLRSGGVLVVANHPTILDVVFLGARMPQADCIVKLGAWRNPFLRGIVSVAGYVANADGPAVVEACTTRLRAGRSVIVFPEGTRSPVGGLRDFRRGAARVALQSQCLVVPVTIRCDPPSLAKGQRWWGIQARRMVFTLDVGAPFHPSDWIGLEGKTSTPRAARQLTSALSDYYESRIAHADV